MLDVGLEPTGTELGFPQGLALPLCNPDAELCQRNGVLSDKIKWPRPDPGLPHHLTLSSWQGMGKFCIRPFLPFGTSMSPPFNLFAQHRKSRTSVLSSLMVVTGRGKQPFAKPFVASCIVLMKLRRRLRKIRRLGSHFVPRQQRSVPIEHSIFQRFRSQGRRQLLKSTDCETSGEGLLWCARWFVRGLATFRVSCKQPIGNPVEQILITLRIFDMRTCTRLGLSNDRLVPARSDSPFQIAAIHRELGKKPLQYTVHRLQTLVACPVRLKGLAEATRQHLALRHEMSAQHQ